jgi:hypothetical protein
MSVRRIMAAPSAAIFSFLTDLENQFLLAHDHTRSLVLDGPPGARHSATLRIRGPLGLPRSARARIIATAEPSHVITSVALGRTVVRFRRTLSPLPASTGVELTAESRQSGSSTARYSPQAVVEPSKDGFIPRSPRSPRSCEPPPRRASWTTRAIVEPCSQGTHAARQVSHRTLPQSMTRPRARSWLSEDRPHAAAPRRREGSSGRTRGRARARGPFVAVWAPAERGRDLLRPSGSAPPSPMGGHRARRLRGSGDIAFDSLYTD